MSIHLNQYFICVHGTDIPPVCVAFEYDFKVRLAGYVYYFETAVESLTGTEVFVGKRE